MPPLIEWATVKAIWSRPTARCAARIRTAPAGPSSRTSSDYLRYGSYPVAERWRVDLTEIDRRRADRLAALARRAAPRHRRRGCSSSSFRSSAFVLLDGAESLGLPHVDTLLWGGVFVSLLTALVGIVFSLPLGVLLALGRRSHLPIVRLASVIFIEFVRGVPFITVLFMANNMLPLFLPPGWEPDRFLRPLVGIALFSAAYMAEEVRGGLQIPRQGAVRGRDGARARLFAT